MALDLTEQQIFDALDVAPQADQGGTPGADTQETATAQPDGTEKAGDGDRAGEDTAAETPGGDAEKDDAGADDTPGDTDDAGDEGTESDDNDGKEELTPEQRAANAKRRREDQEKQRAEQQAAIDEAVTAERRRLEELHRQEMDQLFKDAELKNSVTGKPITSKEEFQAWKRDFAAARLERELKAGKLSADSLNQAIAANPTVQQMQRAAEQQEQARKRDADAAAKARIDAEIAEIGKMDPAIKAPEDLLKMPRAKEFTDYVRKGYTFLDAYRLVNFDVLSERAAEAARQKAMNDARSKDHLKSARQQGTGAQSVPREEMEVFRMLNPGASEKEITDYYNRTKRGV